MNELWQTLNKGGIMMIPLILTSILALTVAIERAIYLKRRRILEPESLRMIRSAKSLTDLQKIMQQLSSNQGPLLNIVRSILHLRHHSREVLREAMNDQGRQEARRMERGLAVLETVSGIAPLMGLLGTVLGMIKVFSVISREGLGQTQLLSGGISEALITTVVGLIIAIPSLIAYNYFVHKVEDLVLEIEKYSSELIDTLTSDEVPEIDSNAGHGEGKY